MSARPLTIQIYLPDGDPNGVRVAEVTTRLVKVIEVPRAQLDRFLKMEEANQVGLYLLIESGEIDQPLSLYVGQTGDLAERLRSHGQKKQFWAKAFVVVSRANSLTQTHGLFLEWMALSASRKAKRYSLVNATESSCPHTPPAMRAECEEVFETASLLLSVLGCPAFEPVITAQILAAQPRFRCSRLAYSGQGYWTGEGFVVLKGSKGPASLTRTCPSGVASRRTELIERGVIKSNRDYIEFQVDHLFTTPSAAAQILQGRAVNGWEVWKTEAGETLDRAIRAKLRGQS